MNKQELYVFLDEQKIKYTAIEHIPVFTVEEAEQLQLPNPEAGARICSCGMIKREIITCLPSVTHWQ